MKSGKFTLSNENINQQIQVLRRMGEDANADRRMLLSSCLSIEEILLNFQAHFGANQEIRYSFKKQFSQIRITLHLSGKSFNPIETNGTDDNGFLIDSLGMAPKFTYLYGVNHVSLTLSCNRSRNELLSILISLALGFIMGFIGLNLPENVLSPCHLIVTAISDAIFSLLRMASLPVMFLCVVYGIIGSGSVNSFRENGLRILGRFFLCMILLLLFATTVCMTSLNIRISTLSSEIHLTNTLVETLFSILPDNIFTPFTNGDNVKVIILGVVFGSAILSLNDKVLLVHQINTQLKDVCSVVLGWIGKLIPLLIVMVLTDTIWSGELGSETLTLWKIVAIYFVVSISALLFMIFKVSRNLHLSFGTVAKTVLLPGLKGIASASSMLCYYDMVEGLTKKLNIPEEEVSFGIPLAIAFYQPIIFLYAIFVLYFTAVTGMSIDVGWLLSFFLVTFVTSVAAPPVSGGSVSLLTVLFATLGISNPMTVMAYPLFMLMDYPNTGFRVMTMMLNVAAGKKKAKGK